jgi:hypothetical protein
MTTANSLQPISTAQQQAIDYIMSQYGVAGASGAAAAGGVDGDASTASLTPEALMLYCQTRLNGIDSQISATMAQQQNASTEQSLIGNLMTEVASYTQQTTNGALKSPADCLQLEQDIEKAVSQIQAIDPGCPELGQLELLHDTVMATGTGPNPSSDPTHGYYNGNSKGLLGVPDGSAPPAGVRNDTDNTLGTGDLQDFTTTLQTIQNSLSSNAALGMVKIQSYMSDRTTAIQLTTSILQAYDDGLEKIADKIGT